MKILELNPAPSIGQSVEKKAFQMGCIFFFLSGASALVYEVLWVRLLGLVFGNTTFAVSAVLSIYMAGLGLGSFFLGRLADRWRHPLWAYGCLEIGVGIYAAMTFLQLQVVQNLYVTFAQQFQPSPALFTAARLVLSGLVLFIPTFFMGGTLPVLAKFYVNRAEAIGSRTAMLYALNTIGAVTGTLLTGFALLPVCGMKSTLAIAVAVNIAIGLLACTLSRELRKAGTRPLPRLTETEEQFFRSQPAPGQPPLDQAASATRERSFWLPLGLFVSGALAMIYEVAWTRILATVLGSSTYAFTVMLATFLIGISFGSAFYESVLSRRNARSTDWAWLQIVIALSVLITLPLFDRVGLLTVRLYALTIGHPKWFEATRFFVSSLFMLVPTFCFGALFPVSTALYTRNPSFLGRSLGFLYLTNTLGNILGSLAAGFALIPILGIYRTFLLTIAFGGLVGLGTAFSRSHKSLGQAAVLGMVALALGGGIWSIRGGWDPRLLTSGLHVRPTPVVNRDSKYILSTYYDVQTLYYKEGLASIVNVDQTGETRYLKVNGKTDASTGLDMMTQLILGHLPHLLHPKPERSLVIGFGSGTTLAAILVHPVSRVDCVEIEPAVLEAAPFFDRINRQSYKDPRVRLIINDGRNHLLVDRSRYDVIMSEPSNPWMAGVSSLFTVEFYKLIREHLNPGGLFCQWLHSYSMHPADFEMVVATLRHVFPHVDLWATSPGDYLIMARAEPIVFDLDHIESEFLQSPKLRADLAPFEIRGAAGLLASFVLGDADLKKYTQEALLNTDDRLYLEFQAPWSLYENTESLIRKTLEVYRSAAFPAIQTVGTPVDKSPDALTQIGESFLNKKLTENARQFFNKALAIDPSLTRAQIGLARCHLNESQWLKAIQVLEETSKKAPKSAEAKGYLGWARLRGGDEEGGLAKIREAVSLDNSRWNFFFWEAQALERLGRWAEAARAYEQALERKPDDIELELGYARSLRQAEEAVKARDFLESMRREYPTYPPVIHELGLAYEKLGEIQSAVTLFEDAVKINPYRSQYWESLAALYLRNRDRENLKRVIREGQKADSYFVNRLINLWQIPQLPISKTTESAYSEENAK